MTQRPVLVPVQVVADDAVVEPIENWSTMLAPAFFQEVRTSAARVRGRLSTVISEAEEAAESATPGFAPSELHEVIWTAAAAHWTTHQYRVAVREESEAPTVHWSRARSARQGHAGHRSQ